MNNYPDHPLIKEKYITASCLIGNHAIYKNGEKIFEDKESNASRFMENIYNHFNIGYPKFFKMDNLGKLGLLASEILLRDSFKAENYQPDDMGIVLSNSNSSLDTDIRYYKSTQDIPSPALFVYTLPNIVIGEICIRNNFKGENAFFVFKQFDATFIAQYVNHLFDTGIVQACICGWVEFLEENYKAVLLLVEKKQESNFLVFTEENINKIYGADNG